MQAAESESPRAETAGLESCSLGLLEKATQGWGKG